MFKKDYVVGLDIGASSVKIAQFIRKEDGLHLIKAGLEEIAYAKDEASREKEVLDKLKSLLKGIDSKNSKFVTSINCPKTAIRRVTAPHMPKGELRDGIRLEAQNYFPFPLDEALLDFEISGDTVEKGVKKYLVVIAVSPGKTVDKYLSLLKKAGIKPASFIPVPYALQKLVQALCPKEDKINSFIEIGDCHTELVIFKGRDLLFSRKIPVAGGDFTRAMTEILVSDRGRTGLSLEEAEKIKREAGIPSEDESGVIDDKISTTQILSMIRAPLEQLVSEIDRCFDYYREETGGVRIDSLILLGGGAALRNLPKFLSEGLGLEVKVGNPLDDIKVSSRAIYDPTHVHTSGVYRFAPAIGAALSNGRGINLLPPAIKEKTKRTIKRTTAEVVAVSVFLILAFIYIGMKIQISNFQKRINVSRMELSNLQPQLKKIAAQNLANNVLADEPYWEDVFKELSHIIPKDIYLTELSMENKAIKMKGIIVSEKRDESLSDFIAALEKGIFRDVKLISTKAIEEKMTSEYELTCLVDRIE